MNAYAAQKKGPLESKRPKSREETPKEGSDSARRYRTATICDRAAQNARLLNHFVQSVRRIAPDDKSRILIAFIT